MDWFSDQVLRLFVVSYMLSPFGVNSERNEFAPVGANYFLLEQTAFEEGTKICVTEMSSLKLYLFLSLHRHVLAFSNVRYLFV